MFKNQIAPKLEGEESGKNVYYVADRSAPRPLVAVLDTGVDWTHPALGAYVWRNAREIGGDGRDNEGNGYADDLRGWSFADKNNRPMDANGHGTHCAGTLVLGGCDVVAVKVLGDGNYGQEAWIAGGIRYAAALGVRAISLSLGGYDRVPKIESAVRYAQARGCAIVAAAGNDATDIREVPIYPACLPGVLSVGALDGARLWASSNRGAAIYAPGKRIRSTLPGNRWGLYSGTSMACPQVAATVARVLSIRPQYTAQQAIARVLANADVIEGVGLVLDAETALAGLHA